MSVTYKLKIEITAHIEDHTHLGLDGSNITAVKYLRWLLEQQEALSTYEFGWDATLLHRKSRIHKDHREMDVAVMKVGEDRQLVFSKGGNVCEARKEL